MADLMQEPGPTLRALADGPFDALDGRALDALSASGLRRTFDLL
jgi:hypothetical protein